MEQMIGKKFGRLTVLEKAIKGKDYNVSNSDKHIYWKCQCDCGKQTIAQGSQLRRGVRVSCGCQPREKAVKLAKQLGEKNRADLIGKRFGKLVVLSLYRPGYESPKNLTEWLCKCDCGKETIVRTNYLLSGHTSSCGCKALGGLNSPSKGEEKIIDLLKKENISFEREKTFSDLKNGKFRYDFYLPEKEICVEFDGKQHFTQVKYFQKTRQDLLKQQENDRQKNSYCLANKIKLYRIPYWELENIKSFKDITQNKFLVTNRYHNDNLWRKFQQDK